MGGLASLKVGPGQTDVIRLMSEWDACYVMQLS